jgi:hypothetical protein
MVIAPRTSGSSQISSGGGAGVVPRIFSRGITPRRTGEVEVPATDVLTEGSVEQFGSGHFVHAAIIAPGRIQCST